MCFCRIMTKCLLRPQKIMDANINLIVFDRKVTGDYTAYLAGDNAGIGREGAKYLGDVLEGKGTIAVMSAPSVGSVSVERTEAFTEEMEKSFPDMKLIQVTADGFTQEAGLKMATDMLVANPEIDAVFSIDDEPSLGILKAVQEAGRTDTNIFPAAAALRHGIRRSSRRQHSLFYGNIQPIHDSRCNCACTENPAGRRI